LERITHTNARNKPCRPNSKTAKVRLSQTPKPPKHLKHNPKANIPSLPVGCVPNSISPGTYIANFTGTYEKPSDLLCAIAVTDDSLIKEMKSSCCASGSAIHADASGCYHWCKPQANDITGWADCISDHVYTETNFGQACNTPGELALKSALDQHEEAPAGTTSGGGRVGGGAGWKVGAIVFGVVALVQVLC
jgi:hypothetical protein